MAKPNLSVVPMPKFDIGGKAALDAEFLKQADQMPKEFLKCYLKGHRWNEDDVWRYPQPGGYVVHTDCERCGMAVETTYIGGLVEARRYIPPEGRQQYGFRGIGHRSQAERAYLVTSWLTLIPIKHSLTG